MPSISMFDKVEFGSDPVQRGKLNMTVGGPLTFDDAKAYEKPVAISFAVFQSPEGQHAISKAKRVRGIAVVEQLDGRWEGTVKVKDGLFHDGEARLIAVAVMARKKMFAYETLTWCENFTLKGTGHADPSAQSSGR